MVKMRDWHIGPATSFKAMLALAAHLPEDRAAVRSMGLILLLRATHSPYQAYCDSASWGRRGDEFGLCT